ncbi:MAG: thioredoxin [Bacteroidota bacterium]
MKLLCCLLALSAAPALAQAPASRSPDRTALMEPDTTASPDTALTDAEQRVADLIQAEGIHVVHFWAPWCDNSVAELRAGWYELVERHPEVSFAFVTIWNDGESARETMDRYGLPERVLELTQPDFGPSDDKAQRRRSFLDLPVTWVPTTWVFRDGGTLAYAFNYGELEMAQLDQAIAGARSSWPHD